jgi:putative transposase
MKLLYHSFLELLATATDQALARYIQYLKEENQILRAKLPKRLTVTAQERRRLVKFGKPLGAAIKDLITIVSPRTFARWVNGETKGRRNQQAQPTLGRPRTAETIRDLILRIARETGWGYTRILGELKKLGIRSVARSTVVNILRENGLDPGPKRGEGTWDEFIKRHAQTLWACDFFTKNVWTLHGLVEFYIFFVIHIGSRRVHLVGMTPHPDRAWIAQQARNLSMFFAEQPKRPTMLLRDHDGKFSREFDAILGDDSIAVHPIGPMAPNLNAYAERWVQSVKLECLNHFVLFGEEHLRLVLREFEGFYNERRPHQALGNAPDDLSFSGQPQSHRGKLSARLTHLCHRTLWSSSEPAPSCMTSGPRHVFRIT